MSAARANNLDLTAPPVVKTIQSRSLIIGAIFAVISLVLAFLRPDEFFRAYLLGYMCWLGVTLGSMAILMIRHLTGGGWGMVIRRILGAAMRCLPLMAILFVPILFGLPKLYVWARPLDSIADKHLREHLQDLTQSYLNVHGFIIRAVIYLAIWNLLSFLLTKWSKETDDRSTRDNTARFKAVSGPGLILYAFTISFAAIDWLMSIDPSWISTIYGLLILIGELLSAMCFAVVVERILVDLQADVGDVETRLRPRPWQVDADLHHGLGLLLVLAVAHYLGRKFAGRNHLVHAAVVRRLGIRWAGPRRISVRCTFRPVAFASFQTRCTSLGLARNLDHDHALPRSFLDHRTQFLQDLESDACGHCGSRCHRRFLAGLLLPQFEFSAAAARL